MYFNYLSMFVLLFCNLNMYAQNSKIWKDVADETFTPTGIRYIVPKKYRTIQLNVAAMQQYLNNAPREVLGQGVPPSAPIIELPLPNGKFAKFQYLESSIMAPELAEKFPEIKTYLGKGIDDKYATIRFDLTPQGFHAQILTINGTYYIDPYSLNDPNYYVVYYKKDYYKKDKFKELEPIFSPNNKQQYPINNQKDKQNKSKELPYKSPDNKLRTYRLALAATGEYTQFHGGTVALALAAMNTSMNRVNGVYERELSVRMNLVANTNTLIYTNANSDPYTNDDGGTMLGENQTNCDNVIGTANYDIGHVFSTGGGGVAYLACVCSSSDKAGGVTGSGSPVGDPFDIDYVAHEMGHQFNGSHAFNSNSGSCSGNRDNGESYEPGSGSTIMSYAGICDSDDLQSNSDDYFHAGSIEDIYIFLQNGGNSCAVKTNQTNVAPVVSANADFTIPKSTPFTLTGSATDSNNDALTYCWEEMDLGSSQT